VWGGWHTSLPRVSALVRWKADAGPGAVRPQRGRLLARSSYHTHHPPSPSRRPCRSYNFEDSQSTVGSQFMNDIQGYAAIRPVMPVAGNHESCDSCAAADALPLSAGNFTEYRLVLFKRLTRSSSRRRP
jgi:hypothetical protein